MTKELPRIDPSKYTVTEKGNVIKPEKVIELPIKGKVNVTLSKKNKRGFEITKEELEKENAELKDKLNNLSGVAVDFFKENYPEYVTEKGECLSPYWDLFSAGVICATFELNNEIAELKEVHESDKRSLALIAKKGADFEKAYNEAEELLDKQIEATYKLFKENKELKEQVDALANVNIKAQNIIDRTKKLLGDILYVYQLGKNELATARIIAEAEKFLKECE